MELRQLNSFVKIAECGSFSQAAESLGYSQSAVTTQIKLLEEELGVKLFDRLGRQVMLTDRGQKFLNHALRILYDVESAMTETADSDELTSPLHVGVVHSLCNAEFPDVVSRFHLEHPKVPLKITVDIPENLISMMEQNALDMIYILERPMWNEHWIQEMQSPEPIVFVTSPGAPPAKKPELLLGDILDEPFFLTEKRANYRQALDSLLQSRHLALTPVLETSDTLFILKILERCDGISFLPYFVVADSVKKRALAILGVRDVNVVMYRQIFYHKNKYKTPEMEEFINLIRARAGHGF